MEHNFNPKLTWNSSRDDIINEFYKPALRHCELYQRLSGYFSSSSFVNVANEILEFIKSDGRIQLITSPKLSETDKKIMEQSVHNAEELLSTIFLDDLKNDPDELKLEFSKLMAYMLTNYINGKPQLEIKIAKPSTGPGIFHQKIGILKYKNGKKIAFAGSINETGLGWHENIENFTVFRSWGDDTHRQGIIDNQKEFNDLWDHGNDEVDVFDLPIAVKKHLLKIRPESNKELENTIAKIKQIISDKTGIISNPNLSPQIKLRQHQIDAINKWKENNYCGLLEMATGTGKTYTAFGCINAMQRMYDRTAIIIACPQLHLVEQWKDSMDEWNNGVNEFEKIIVDSQITCNSDNPGWRSNFEKLLYDFNVPPLGSEQQLKNNIIIFVTHDTLALSVFNEKISSIENAKKFLIIDEVHNVTEKSSEKILLDHCSFRLGLSATPERHLDEQGTQILLNYFHGIVYELNLDKAIHELNVLSTYDYLPYYVALTTNEMEEYHRLTGLIAQIEEKKRKGIYHKKPGDFDPYLARSALVANAENKDGVLKSILDLEFNNKLSDTLIYCTNNPSPISTYGYPKQLERVKHILSSVGIVSDSITWEDKTKDRRRIIELLSAGHFNCITAVGCLDEGVDIPSVQVGIFMASSGNPKQFIQRRGRILRKSENTGKVSATIYDILVTPSIDNEPNMSQRKLIAKELIRHKEFASIADNKKMATDMIKDIAEKFSIDLEQLSDDYIKTMS